jgi:predicted aspartyl protease
MNQHFKSFIVGCILWWGLVASAQSSVAQVGHSVQSRAHQVNDQQISFDLYRGYLMVVRGSIGGLKNLNFLVDTGAEPSIVDRRLARKLNLPQRDAQVSVLNRSVAAESAVLPDLEVGPIQVSKLPVLVEDLSFLQEGLQSGIDAVIGFDVLGRSSFTIEYGPKTIRFGAPASMSFSVPLFREGQLATIDLQLNNHRFRFLVDTGASSLMLFASRMQGLMPDLEVQNVKHSSNLAGEFERAQVHLRSVKIGDMNLGQQNAFLVDDQRDPTRGFDGLLSPPALGLKQVAFDLDRGTLGWSK